MFVLETSKSAPLLAKAMSARGLRQKMIASNLANIDTPFYKARDINFESELRAKKAEIYNKSKNKELKLAKTDKAHFEAVKFPKTGVYNIFLRDGHTARNDANTVDLDVETSELSKNQTMMSAVTNAYKRNSSIFKSVIESSNKL
ncbi:flagellar basal body rod protein FlgB [Campylobacter majalis]|uniref:flagellar basal body rod protein FlgB n=1 Tax=Campylobacter majalis TaxID=2790656 RepID=UPI003D689561